MSIQIDQAISAEINELLLKAHLNAEMLQLIKSSLNVESNTGELFPWANLTLLSCACVNGLSDAALPGAIAMELFALAADILDDVQDQDNDKLPWQKLGNANAINLAVCLLMLSNQAIAEIADIKLSREVDKILNRTGVRAINAQFREFQYGGQEQISLDQYFELIEQKSGSLVACACKIGATLGNASEKLVLQLEQFGTNLGIMDQIRNDLNDFLDFKRKKDFINNTKTLPLVYLLTVFQDRPNKLQELTELQSQGLRKGAFGNVEQEYLKQIVIEEGVAHYCKVMYEIFRQNAMENLRSMSVPENGKEKLIKLVEKSV